MTRHFGRRLARLEKGAGRQRLVLLAVEKLDGLDVDAELTAQGRNIGPDDELVVVATGVPKRNPAPTQAITGDPKQPRIQPRLVIECRDPTQREQ